jgi:hypothetical protein
MDAHIPAADSGMRDGSSSEAGSDGGTSSKIIFVSSMVYTGNLGGLDGADGKCQTLAMAVNPPLPGSYKAWLSSSTTAAKDRLTHSVGPYVLVDGKTKVANDWNDLTSHTWLSLTRNPLPHAINITEKGDPAPTTGTAHCGGDTTPRVWTNTKADGNLATPFSQYLCNPSPDAGAAGDWTSPTSPAPHSNPQMGGTDQLNQYWSRYCGVPSAADGCALTASL